MKLNRWDYAIVGAIIAAIIIGKLLHAWIVYGDVRCAVANCRIEVESK